PGAIDLAVGSKPGDQHRDIVFAALAVDHIGEEKRLAVLLGDAAAELPAHQRVHLGVLVDLAVDLDQEPGLVERADVFVQVGIGARGRSLTIADRVHMHSRMSSDICSASGAAPVGWVSVAPVLSIVLDHDPRVTHRWRKWWVTRGSSSSTPFEVWGHANPPYDS